MSALENSFRVFLFILVFSLQMCIIYLFVGPALRRNSQKKKDIANRKETFHASLSIFSDP